MNMLSEQQLKDLREYITAIVALATCVNIAMIYIGLAFISDGLGL